MPPIKFGYDLYKKNLQGFVSSINNAVKTVTISFNPNSETFEEGDIVTFNQNGVAYHGYVANLSPGYLFLKNISSPPRVGQIDGLDKTKNPPYNKDLYDIWGMYKSDYVEIPNSNLSHYPSDISSKNTDVWSLREIENPTGAKTIIEYETDTFSESVLRNLTIKIDSSLPPTGQILCTNPDPYSFTLDRWVELTFKISSPSRNSLNFDKRYQLGEQVDIAADITVTTNFPYTQTTSRSISYASVTGLTKDEMKISACINLSIFNLNAGFYKGKASLKPSVMSRGGGVRVKRLIQSNPNSGEQRATNYKYDFDGISSGVTSYEPVSPYTDKDLKASFLTTSPLPAHPGVRAPVSLPVG